MLKPDHRRPKHKHSWEIMGDEPDTGIPNIWRCRACKMYRVSDDDGLSFEYSKPSGEVISWDPEFVPLCIGKEK